MIFRLQNNVPEVYVDKSMDFQLFTRIFDLAFNSTKYSINTISRIPNTVDCDETTLPLLAYKLGFFENTNLTHKQLRLLLSAFPTIIHNKGTFRAVEQVVYLFSRLNDSKGTVQGPMNYTFQLVFYPAITNMDLLITLLKMVVQFMLVQIVLQLPKIISQITLLKIVVVQYILTLHSLEEK